MTQLTNPGNDDYGASPQEVIRYRLRFTCLCKGRNTLKTDDPMVLNGFALRCGWCRTQLGNLVVEDDGKRYIIRLSPSPEVAARLNNN
ncbi:MAG: hypothetical protein KKF56_00030 [Nanoarchaeota archaeon]|nr:hypothetical protein [Nanoarchaeota archaeon]